MTIREKMHSRALYIPTDSALMREQRKRQHLMQKFNSLSPLKQNKRQKLMKKIFCEVGDGCFIEGNVFSNFGCANVHFGNNVYANFNLTLVDDTHIYIGDYTMIGPNVTIATAGHPPLPELRKKGYQFNASVKIGENCWIGAGAIILPGVEIGDNSIIGAGSIVTKSIPKNSVAVGNPCKVLREINEHDREYYFKDLKIPKELL